MKADVSIIKNIEKHGIKTKFSICCMLFIENNYIRAEPEERNHFFRERVLILERGNINAEKHSTYPMPTVWQRQAHGCSEPCKCGKTTAIRPPALGQGGMDSQVSQVRQSNWHCPIYKSIREATDRGVTPSLPHTNTSSSAPTACSYTGIPS